MPLKDLFKRMKRSGDRSSSPSRNYMEASTKKMIDSIPKAKRDGYKQLFDKFDKNRDGRLAAEELHTGLQGLGQNVTLDEAKQIILKTDLNGDGVLDFSEFLLVVLSLGQAPAQGYVRKIFDKLDTNKDGKLDRNEVTKGMHAVDVGVTDQDVTQMMEVADLDKDGMINFHEFCVLLDTLYSQGKLSQTDLRD